MANIAIRKCKFCGKEYRPNSPYQVYCKNPHYRICPICGKQYQETNNDKLKFPPTTCSKECKVAKIKQTSLEKYGITAPGNNPEARNKSKRTMQERYGVDHAMQSDEIREKSKETLIERYGVDNAQKNKEIRNKTEQTNIQKYGSKTYLTSEQGEKRINNIMIEKYGTTIPLRNDMIKEKWKQTNLEKYGVDNPSKNVEVQNRMKLTSLLRYGTEYPPQSEIVKQKSCDTFIRNYGVDNPFKSRQIIKKIHESFFEKYGVHGVMQVEEIANRIRETTMKKYGVPYYIMLPNVAKSSGRISNINKHILHKLSDAGIYGELEYTIGRTSYDIKIPQGNILLEINPSYTHSTEGNHWNPSGISKYYHIKKTMIAAKHGCRCIHLWDWDCVSKFINSLTVKHIVYSDKLELIERDEAESFIEQYSLYKIDTNKIISIGIRYKSKLICMIGFQMIDPITKIWNIVCIEHRFNHNVYNGYSKILKYFEDNYQPNKIIAFADLSKSNGEILAGLGFEYVKFILPNKIWSKGRHAIIDDPSIISEAMMQDGWLPVYNCGYSKYQKCYSSVPGTGGMI